jgi:hypothetical protein
VARVFDFKRGEEMKTTIEYDMWDIGGIFAFALLGVYSSPWFLFGVGAGIIMLFVSRPETQICSFGWIKGKGWWFKK